MGSSAAALRAPPEADFRFASTSVGMTRGWGVTVDRAFGGDGFGFGAGERAGLRGRASARVALGVDGVLHFFGSMIIMECL